MRVEVLQSKDRGLRLVSLCCLFLEIGVRTCPIPPEAPRTATLTIVKLRVRGRLVATRLMERSSRRKELRQTWERFVFVLCTQEEFFSVWKYG